MNVEEAHEHEHHPDQSENCLKAHVAFGPRNLRLVTGAASKIPESFAQPGGRAVFHSRQGVNRPDAHAAHGNLPHDVSPHDTAHRCPLAGGSAPNIAPEPPTLDMT